MMQVNDIIVNSLSVLYDEHIKKESKSLEGCTIYKPSFGLRRLLRCKHEIVVDEFMIKQTIVTPQDFDQDIWDGGRIFAIKIWLIKNCKGNYKFIVVPCDEFDKGYSQVKRNRIKFSNVEDAMAFKLEWI